MSAKLDLEENESRSWAEEVADLVIRRGKKSYVCEGMWTPSGFFHIGNARAEIFTPFAVKKSLERQNQSVIQNFIVDDFDAIRKIPGDLGIPVEDQDTYLGFPCATAPSPVSGYENWADLFVSQVKRFSREFGVELNIISAYETYKSGKFNEWILFALNHSAEIVNVWKDVSGTEKESEFLPIQVVCQACKKIYYTVALNWDQREVEYSCKCGHAGKVSPLNGNAKLNWRVHWVCHWIVHQVDFESGGKDHFSKGGSVDVGRELMRKVFKREPPVQFPTEFIQLAGQKMSGSKGNVINLEQWLSVASPELFRFLNFSYNSNTALEFSLSDNSFILLNARFDRYERIYYGFEEPSRESKHKITSVYEMSLMQTPNPRIIQVPYPFLTSIAQLFDPANQLDEAIRVFHQTGHLPPDLNETEKMIVRKKLERARNWVNLWAPEQYKVVFLVEPPTSLQLTNEQKNVFLEIGRILPSLNGPDDIQKAIYEISRKHKSEPKTVFQLLYQCILGKTSGPKFGNLVFAFGKEKTIQRINECV